MTDYAVQSDDDEVLPVLTEGIVHVLSLDIAKICSSYALESVSAGRVNGCTSIAPFARHIIMLIALLVFVRMLKHFAMKWIRQTI